jgi:LacI family transcriptional regulator
MASRAEGIIVVTAKSPDFVMDALELDGTPAVVIGAAHRGVSTVSIDHRLGAELAVAHLIRLGHRRIGLISEGRTAARGAAQRDGYEAAVERAHLEFDEGLIETSEPTRPASGAEACAALFHRGRAPTAIFATSDATALGCYTALGDFGLRVPGDISVVGYGNSSYGRYVSPPLTTVSLPLAAAGNEAAALILEQLGETAPDESRQVQLRPYLLQRLSSGRAP